MIKVEKMDNIAPGNPFHSDLFHVGTGIGTNVMIMHRSLSGKEYEKYIIVVNTETGERVLIRFDEDANLDVANAVQSIKEEKEGGGGATFHTETLTPRTKEEIARDIFFGEPHHG